MYDFVIKPLYTYIHVLYLMNIIIYNVYRNVYQIVYTLIQIETVNFCSDFEMFKKFMLTMVHQTIERSDLQNHSPSVGKHPGQTPN